METRPFTEVLDVESSPFAAEDYVQLACSLRRSAEMRIRYPDGRNGGIVINKGELWHAWDNLGGGNEAFLRMVGIARVTRIRGIGTSDTTTRTINESCHTLLLQALIARDASGSAGTTAPKAVATNAADSTKRAARPNVSQPSTAYTANVSDSELTRPNWPALRNGVMLPPEPDAEALTARSYTERPVEISATPAAKPRSIRTFLRQPSIVQRGLAVLFGAILLASIGQILASPAGGDPTSRQSTRVQDMGQPKNRSLDTGGTTQQVTGARVPGVAAERPVVIRSLPSEVVFKVSSLKSADWAQSTSVVTRVHNVSTTGGLDTSNVARHVISATAQFAACYEWTASRSLIQRGLGNIAVVVNIDKDGSVASASSRGGKLQGLNTCVAQVAERLGMLLKQGVGPSRLAWTVSYLVPDASTTSRVVSEIH